MFVDSRTLVDNSAIHADICIVGAGPAGLAIAREFAGTNIRVAILESGGFEFQEEIAALTDGETEGDPFSPLRDMRHRQFGGMSNVWNIELYPGRIGVRYVPLDPIDFEKRDWVPHSGWPVTYDEVVPYYRRAHAFCQLGEFDYAPDGWESQQHYRTQFKTNELTTGMFKFGPSDAFFRQYRKEVELSKNITVYLHANVIELRRNEATGIGHIIVACLQGTKLTVTAKNFVLAAGGMENARLLLASNREEENGIGNRNDVVGRYFMDHPLVDFGTLHPFDHSTISSMRLYDKKRINNETVMGRYAITGEAMRRHRLLNISALIYPRNNRFRSQAKASLKLIVASLKQRQVPPHFLRHCIHVLSAPHHIVGDIYQFQLRKLPVEPNLAKGNWSLEKDVSRFVKFEVLCQTEQAPHPDNRVTLSEDRDALGVPRVKLTNVWREHDIDSVRRSQQLFAKAFEDAGTGQLVFDDTPKPGVLMSTHHNMGTTRMHADPHQGVVDANCKVHGVSNLFVAGSSVFTTGGYANPTLTIIALGIRLADHLKKKSS